MHRIQNHPVAQKLPQKKEVNFTFDGKVFSGLEGEAISSALFANGVKTFSEHHKDGAAQGIFCANGQCSQCSLMVDGIMKKACVTLLKEGMDLRTVHGLPQLPLDDSKEGAVELRKTKTDILVIGGGPSGLSAAIELAKLGFNILLADDKDQLGGKLVLQTHKFFGSEEDCYAGTRGYEIANLLCKEIEKYPNIKVLTNSPVVGMYEDKCAGIYENYNSYLLVEFNALLISSGARERSLVFKGNDLPGVYGAGAFQTLVNRDLVKAADKVFVIGSGNVGLIGSYHALQAGIHVAGICEILPNVNGYKVHADKIKRMGVPIYLSTSVISVEGDGKVERVTIAKVDDKFQPLLETAKTFEVDTVLVATGLSPCDELYKQAERFGFIAVKAGDAEEIAEASSAMFGGKISALKLAKLMGKDEPENKEWLNKREVLKSRPGQIIDRGSIVLKNEWAPNFFCTQEIPCNPCTTVCPTKTINLSSKHGNILDLPYYKGSDCKGCNSCIAACPGLAISLVRKTSDGKAEVRLPFEFDANSWEKGKVIPLLDQDGNFVEDGILSAKLYNNKYKTWILTFTVSEKNASKIIGLSVQDKKYTDPLPEAKYSYMPENAIVCRCERITVKEIIDFIKDNNVRDINSLKSLRVGMGACGSKTCSVLLPQIFRMAGVDFKDVTPGYLRPLLLETSIGDIINENRGGQK